MSVINTAGRYAGLVVAGVLVGLFVAGCGSIVFDTVKGRRKNKKSLRTEKQNSPEIQDLDVNSIEATVLHSKNENGEYVSIVEEVIERKFSERELEDISAFDSVFDKAKDIEYSSSWENGTGYLNGAVKATIDNLEVGEWGRCVDTNGRKIIVRKENNVNIVFNERFVRGMGTFLIVMHGDRGRCNGTVVPLDKFNEVTNSIVS